MTLDALRSSLAAAGLNLTSTLPVEEYDRLVPEPWRTQNVYPSCKGVLIVGNGGRVLWPLFKASPEAQLRKDPLDRYTRHVLRESAAAMRPQAHAVLYTDKRENAYLPLVALAQRAGFGVPGRVGVLLHPHYGPWISIRAALLLGQAVAFEESAPFDPCTGCPAPCESACHGQVVSRQGVDTIGCFRTISSSVSSLVVPSTRSRATFAPKRAAPTPRPVYPPTHDRSPPWEVPHVAVN